MANKMTKRNENKCRNIELKIKGFFFPMQKKKKKKDTTIYSNDNNMVNK